MMQRDQIIAEIRAAIQRANELRPPGEQIPCQESALLYGSGGPLDSLGLVSLVLDIEEAINARTGRQIVLADDRAVSQRRSPFRDVGSLADHVMARLAEAGACPNAQSS
jgi:acyl carrier protein